MSSLKLYFLCFCAGIVAFSCVAYELLLGSYATFLMGASIFQYSLVISLMMFSMGLGALASRKFTGNSYLFFLSVELILAWVALLAVPMMYVVFSNNFAPSLILIFFVLLIGTGIGMEIPLISEIVQSPAKLPTILFYDYLVGFLGGIAFPLLLFPKLGFFPIGALLALINACVGLSFFCFFHRQFTKGKRWLGLLTGLTIVACGLELILAEHLKRFLEKSYFNF